MRKRLTRGRLLLSCEAEVEVDGGGVVLRIAVRSMIEASRAVEAQPILTRFHRTGDASLIPTVTHSLTHSPLTSLA